LAIPAKLGAGTLIPLDGFTIIAHSDFEEGYCVRESLKVIGVPNNL